MNNLSLAKKDFLKHFGYLPNDPREIHFNEEEYIAVLRKSINENFDYTIELYGTDPKYGTKKHSGVFID